MKVYPLYWNRSYCIQSIPIKQDTISTKTIRKQYLENRIFKLLYTTIESHIDLGRGYELMFMNVSDSMNVKTTLKNRSKRS